MSRKRRRKDRLKVSPPPVEAGQEFGVYAAHISALQKSRLAQMPLELGPEIHMLRALVDDSLRRMENCEDEELRLKLFKAALAAMQRLLSALRAQRVQAGRETDESEFEKTLAEVRQELGLKGPE